jgi:hypothetical protein
MPELGKQFKPHVPLHDLTQGFGPDVYDNLDKYTRSPVVKDLILRAKNDPAKKIRVHMLVPTGSRGVNEGDVGWLDRAIASEHGKATMANGFRIATKNVAARELFTDGDLSKWTWNPPKETK